jgi:hypothetical protein
MSQFRDTNKKPETVVVSWKDGGLSVDKDPVEINWDVGPDSIHWRFVDMPSDVTFAAVSFKGQSCFRAIGGSAELGVIGTLNTGEGGAYKYGIAVFNRDGKVVAQLDPGILNNPGG